MAGARNVFNGAFRAASILGLSRCHRLHDVRSWEPLSPLLEAISLAGVRLFRGDREVGGHGHPSKLKAETFEISGLKSHM